MIMDGRELIALAKEARKNAYIPYSGFSVGAALLAKSGRVYTGCNIESATFSPTICAERTAFAKAISEGEREFEAIAIVGGSDRDDEICYPCGVCRQVMSEFCSGDFKLYFADGEEVKEYSFDEMMPYRFYL
ncbi:MAG: cytidine deaminase [Clostridia bacterium]|nr:cytidine deaminase [Clostridia bacterium]